MQELRPVFTRQVISSQLARMKGKGGSLVRASTWALELCTEFSGGESPFQEAPDPLFTEMLALRPKERLFKWLMLS